MSQRIRIGLTLPLSAPNYWVRTVASLANGLAPRQFEVHVVAPATDEDAFAKLLDQDVYLHLLPAKRRYALPPYFAFSKLLKQIDPHVVHSFVDGICDISHWWAATCRAPVYLQSWREGALPTSWYQRLLNHSTTGRADSIIVNTPVERWKHIPACLSNKSLRVISSAVQAPPPKPVISREELFQRLAIPPRRFVVAAVADFNSLNGSSELLWASELLRVVLKDIWVLMIGDGSQLVRLQQLRDDYGAQDVARFVGARADFQELIPAFDLLLDGNLCCQADGPILQAMAAGVPAIAMDLPGNRHLIEHGRSGYLYVNKEVGELTRFAYWILSDQSRWQEMGQQAKQFALNSFSRETMINSHVELYQSLWQQCHERRGE